MFSDTQFQRLLWKEYRQQRTLWLAIAIATPLFQELIFGLMWWANGPQPLRDSDLFPLGVIGYACIAVYLLGCAATMFSVEHEASTFDFQRVLPATQPRVFWAKILFAAASGVAMTAWLWLVTRGVFLISVHEAGWFRVYGLLYLAELFAWSILASLLIRHPLWSVVAAVSAQSLMLQVVVPSLFGVDFFNSFKASDPRLLASRLTVMILLVVVDVYVGKLWFEDRLRWPKWRSSSQSESATAISIRAATPLPMYLGPRQLGWQRLLWLSWRDARWLIGAIVLSYAAIAWRLNAPENWSYVLWVGGWPFPAVSCSACWRLAWSDGGVDSASSLSVDASRAWRGCVATWFSFRPCCRSAWSRPSLHSGFMNCIQLNGIGIQKNWQPGISSRR